MSRILIIEDDRLLSNSINQFLKIKNYKVKQIFNGQRGYEYIIKQSKCCDLIVLDINLPKLSGLEICHKVRNKGIQIPILILTQEKHTNTLLNAFELGADEYLKKPFELLELEARIRILLKASKRLQQIHNEIDINDLKILITERKVTKKAHEIPLRRKEFDLLLFLAKNPDTVISRDTILANVWNFDFEPFPNTVDAHISYLRKKIGDREQKLIQTVHGIGYRLNSH